MSATGVPSGVRGSAAVLTLMLMTSCARCAPATPDAGTPTPDAGPARVKRSTDLRSALFATLPEWRGIHLFEGRAVLTRQYVSLPDEALSKSNAANGFAPTEDGGLYKKPFHQEKAGPATLTLWMPVDLTTAEKVFTAPMALSSMEMGLYLPRGLPVARETFSLWVYYRAIPAARAGFLTRQLVELLTGSGQWKAEALPAEGWGPNPGDGGYGEVPELFEVTLKNPGTTAQVTLKREGPEVRVRYTLETDAPAR